MAGPIPVEAICNTEIFDVSAVTLASDVVPGAKQAIITAIEPATVPATVPDEHVEAQLDLKRDSGTHSLDSEEDVPEDESEIDSLTGFIEMYYNNKPLPIDPIIESYHSLRDLFRMIRIFEPSLTKKDELWFRIMPLGLEIGEENGFNNEPTLKDLLEIMDYIAPSDKYQPHIKIYAENRPSFYYKFHDYLKCLDLDNFDEGRDNFV